MRVLAAALALLFSASALAGPMTRRTEDTVARTFAFSIYNYDVDFDVDGDTQKQTYARTCNNPAALSYADPNVPPNCTQPSTDDLGVAGGGTVPSVDDCRVQFDCVDPVTHVSVCSHAPSCETSWREEGLKVLDAQVATHLGLQRESPERAKFVIQVGDNTELWNYTSSQVRNANTSTSPPLNTPSTHPEVLLEATNFVNRYAAPLVAAGMPTMIVDGNHDEPYHWEQLVKPVVLSQPNVYDTAQDPNHLDTTTMYSIVVPTPVGKICIAGYPFAFYADTLAAGIGLVGCGASLPTIAVKHNGNTNFLDSGCTHTNLFGRFWGHFTPNNYTLSAITECAVTKFTLFANFQFQTHRWVGDAIQDGHYWGITAHNGTDGIVMRCKLSPARSTIMCRPYNPMVRSFKSWAPQANYTGTIATYNWCSRFAC